MIRIVPTTLDELDELITEFSGPGMPDVLYRHGFSIIHPETGQSVAGGGVAANTARPEWAGYRCWHTDDGQGNAATHHVHGPDEPCPLGGFG